METNPAPNQTTVVNTSSGLDNGLNRCPYCGSTDIVLDPVTGKLKCQMCRSVFDPVTVANDDIHQLSGELTGSGATDIIPDTKDVLTFKCGSCGAEVVIDTSEATSARCHWCRHSLSVNEQIENGAVPDMVLPFKMDKPSAQGKITAFVKKRQFFAHPVFRREFTTDNIMGVYLPYMVVDVNGHSKFVGQGEHLVKTHYGKSDENTRYDADLYDVSRDFDLLIDDLSIESSADKRNQDTARNTNNVINAIMPFDTENCVKWNANYLKGYASEKRDTNIEDLRPSMVLQAKDIARYQASTTTTFYDRGTAWSEESMTIKGASWKSAYLPVWLYSYYQKDKKLLHYCAVNARTGETMGSVPLDKSRLFIISLIVELFSSIIGTSWIVYFWSEMSNDPRNISLYGALGYTGGFIFYWIIWRKYRNAEARHYHEKETKSAIENLQQTDNFVEHRQNLKNPKIAGANNDAVDGSRNTNALGGLGKLATGVMNKTIVGAIIPKKFK
jgi:ribosomal protein S27E